MSRIKRYRTLLLIAVPLFMTACEPAKMKNEHNNFVKSSQSDWDKQRLVMMYQVAEQQYKVGEFEKCRASIAEALKADTPFAPFHVLAAKVNLEGGSLDEAAMHLKLAIQINSVDPKVHGRDAEPYYLMGLVNQRIQKFEEAADYYQQAADKKPDDASYAVAVAEMKISLGQLDEAKEYLDNKMAIFEESSSMRIALARIAMLQGDSARAAQLYRDVVLLLPEDKNVRWSYAEALVDAGKYGDAAKILEDLRQDPPILPKSQSKLPDSETDKNAASANKVSILMTLGECYVNLKRNLDARDCFQEIIREQPANISAYLALGKTSLVADDLSLTRQAAQRVLRYEPDNVQAMILQAAVDQKEKKWSDALKTLTGATRLAPRNSTVWCMAGISALQLGNKNDATNYFERAVAANPADIWAGELLQSVKPAPVPAAAQAPAPEAAPLVATPEPTPSETDTTKPESNDAVTDAVPILPDAQ